VNIPEKVKISYITFDVIMKETLTVMDRDLQFGEIDYFNGKINIYKGNESNAGKSDFCKEQQECSLIHEAIHGMNEFNKIGLAEEQIVKLGMAFYNFIQDNPDVFKEKPFENTDNKLSIFDHPAGTKKDLKPRMGMDIVRAKLTQFLSGGVIEDSRDSYQERADVLLSFELEPRITLKDIIGFYYYNVTEENT